MRAGATAGRVTGWVLAWALLLACVIASCAPQPVHAAAAQRVAVVPASALYRLKIERAAAREFGLNAPVARLAAQIHQESAWRPRAASAYAQGLTQFTPATARWVPSICPVLMGVDAWDAGWAIDAQACYMRWLTSRILPFAGGGPLSTCSRWALALRAYNGGEGWINRERLKARMAGDDANDWLRVEKYRVRGAQFFAESIGYPRRILLLIEPAYRAAGWPGKADCA